MIALGAKMAKADGIVTKDEVVAFREVFVIPAEEEANAARVFKIQLDYMMSGSLGYVTPEQIEGLTLDL